MGEFIYYGFIIRILLESYFDLLLASLLVVKSYSWNVEGEKASFTISLIISSCLLAFPYFCLGLLMQYTAYLDDNDFKKKFLSLYQDFKWDTRH